MNGTRVVLLATLTGFSWSAAGAENPATGAPAEWVMHNMGGHPYGMVLIDRMEYGNGDDTDTYLWDVQGWYGGDYNKLAVKTEGESETAESVDDMELQVLYDRLVAPFWTLQAGVRYDVQGDQPDVGYAVAGLQGLAPQWFETDLALFVSEDGDVSIRGELEYDLRLSQRLILQPQVELDASFGDVPELGRASGLNRTEAGLRLRYEIRREFAPYIGVRWDRLHGGTADLARAAGEPRSMTSLVVGLRAWF